MELGAVLNPVHILTTYFKVHFNIILIIALRFIKFVLRRKVSNVYYFRSIHLMEPVLFLPDRWALCLFF
jgi:hypothetical protein